MVLPVRIELTTSPLPRECSTTELRQRPFRLACNPQVQAEDRWIGGSSQVKPGNHGAVLKLRRELIQSHDVGEAANLAFLLVGKAHDQRHGRGL